MTCCRLSREIGRLWSKDFGNRAHKPPKLTALFGEETTSRCPRMRSGGALAAAPAETDTARSNRVESCVESCVKQMV